MKTSHCQHQPANLEHANPQEQIYLNTLARKTWVAIIPGAILALDSFFAFIPALSTAHGQIIWFIIGIITLWVLVYAAGHIYAGALNSFKARNANMDTLIAIGTGSAWIYSMVVVLLPNTLPSPARGLYFETALIIIAFINLGAYFETRARGKTSAAIKRLIGLQPKTARLVKNGIEQDLPIEQIQVNDILRVRPGEKIAVDGIIVEGHSDIDESMLTGESNPIHKSINDQVNTGTLNIRGSFLYKATRVGKDTALARIVEMVRQAQNSKPNIARLVDKISAYFVPLVLIIAIVTALIWYNFGPQPQIVFMLITAISVLIIACPCALGLGTPLSIMVGVGKAAEYGILIRNGEALQATGKLTTIVLDKTGTITAGKPGVTSIWRNSEILFTEDHLLQLAASLEAGSEHSLAIAILNAAKQKNLTILPTQNFLAIPGHGVSGNINNQNIAFGNNKLMQKLNIDVATYQVKIAELTNSAETPIFLSIDNKIAAIFAISDPIKVDSKTAITELQRLGLKVIMLTGDNQKTAKAIASQIGISNFYAELLPQDKLNIIEKLQSKNEKVGMVGDGINDAPALAKADVGFAIGAGTDTAIESADITLIRNSLQNVVDAIKISKATMRNIKQNLFGAFGYNILSIPIAAGILYPFIGILLHPMIAGAAMAASSLTIVVNANRLRFFGYKK